MTADVVANAGVLEHVFFFCAVAGTIVFLIRFVLLLAGGADSGMEAAADVASDANFSVLSINTITAFIMMFGWAGLSCYVQFSLGAGLSVLIAFIVGVACMVITAQVFRLAGRLVSKGTAFDIAATVGTKAGVYQKIPAAGRGRVTVTIAGSNTRELDAVAEDQAEIASFKTVEIVRVVDANTVAVREVA